MTNEIGTLVHDFTINLAQIMRAQVREEVMAVLDDKMAGKRDGKVVVASFSAGKKARKKGPLQLCPVPKCTNAAAPVFGMVCAEHKGLPKKKIAEYREARRKAKAKATGKKPAAKKAA